MPPLPALDVPLLTSTFVAIACAELPDKTALATVMLASGKRPMAVLIGVAAAFLIQTAVAVASAQLLALLPTTVVRVASGALFLAFAAAMVLRRGDDEEESAEGVSVATPIARFWPIAGRAFVVIFIAEWGDLTQVATAALAADAAKRHGTASVFVGALLALWAVAALAVFVGHRLQRHLKPRPLRRIAAVVFAVIGALLLAGVEIGRG